MSRFHIRHLFDVWMVFEWNSLSQAHVYRCEHPTRAQARNCVKRTEAADASGG